MRWHHRLQVNGKVLSDLGELHLRNTFNNGQIFKWQEIAPNDFVGVLQNRVLRLKQNMENGHILVMDLTRNAISSPLQTSEIDRVLGEYFQLHIPLRPLYEEWKHGSEQMKHLCSNLQGMRIIQQDPFECLICFMLSSNNNISRIKQMVAKLLQNYGTEIPIIIPEKQEEEEKELEEEENANEKIKNMKFYSFPTLEQLSKAREEDLRSLGFGYRAKFICNAMETLKGMDLMELRRNPDRLAVREMLMKVNGVGPKVADCTALFSLDKKTCIPCDTHVLQIAERDYSSKAVIEQAHKEAGKPVPKSLTPWVYELVGDIFRKRFGDYAGWGHCLLFAGELKEFSESTTMTTEKATITTATTSTTKSKSNKSNELKKRKRSSCST